MSNSLASHGLLHTRLLCPPLSIRICSDSCLLDGDAIQPSHPLPHRLLLLSIFLSITVFSNESALRIRWTKYWSFNISASNEYSELISFRTNGFEIVLFHLSSALLYDGKESSCNAGDLGSIPGLGRSPGEGNVNPLHYSCLENPMDRGALWAMVHAATKSQTQMGDQYL